MDNLKIKMTERNDGVNKNFLFKLHNVALFLNTILVIDAKWENEVYLLNEILLC